MGVYRIVTFKLDSDVVEKLDEIALRRGITRSEVIREAIFRYLRDEYSDSYSDMMKRRLNVRRIVIA